MAILKNSEGRAFISIDTGCGQNYTYQGCIQIDGLDKSFGEATPLYCPSDTVRGQFVEEDSIEGTDSRWTSSLTNTLRRGQRSILEQIINRNCSFSIQIHYGACNLPTDYTGWSEMYMLDNVRLTNYSTTQMTTTGPDGLAAIQETAAISIGSVRKLYNPTIAQMDNNDTFNVLPRGNIVYCDVPSCSGSECGAASDGCTRMFQVGENSFQPNSVILLYSIDGGINWSGHTLIGAEDTTTNRYRSTCRGNLLYFMSVPDSSSTIIYEVDTTTVGGASSDVSFRIVTIFDSAMANFTIQGGTVYAWNGNSIAAANLTSGTIQYFNLPAGNLAFTMAFFNDDTSIAVSENNMSVSYTFGIYQDVPNFLGNIGVPTDAHMFSESNWLIAGQGGVLCTKDGGQTWQQTIAFTEVHPNVDIDVCDSLVYLNNGKALYRSTNGGGSWELIFQDTSLVSQGGAFGLDICDFDCNEFIFGMEDNIYRGTV